MKKNNSQFIDKSSKLLQVQQFPKTCKIKKIEGHDANRNSNYDMKIKHLRSQPKKNIIEEQYINGLQDEIKYLEMEVKLLHQQDLAKHGHIDQLQQFFKDGIPINENILAIKNGFNNYKTIFEKQKRQLQTEKKQRELIIQNFHIKSQQIYKQLQEQQKNIQNNEYRIIQNGLQLLKTENKLKKQLEIIEQQIRNEKKICKEISLKINNIEKNKEIQFIMNMKIDNHKYTKLNQLKQNIVQNEKQLQEIQKCLEIKQKQENQQSYVFIIEEQNLKMKKKIISKQKQLNSLQTKIEQKKIDLIIKLKNRQKQIHATNDIKNRIELKKNQLQYQNSITIQELQENAKQKQVQILYQIVNKNKKVQKYINYYSELLGKIEDEIQILGEKKPQLRSEINTFNSEIQIFNEQQKNEKQQFTELYASIIYCQAKINKYKNIITPIEERNKQIIQLIKSFEKEKKKLNQEIKIKQKQLNLVLLLKTLNLQEVEMSKSSGTNIQQKLIHFIQNWQTLYKSTKI